MKNVVRKVENTTPDRLLLIFEDGGEIYLDPHSTIVRRTGFRLSNLDEVKKNAKITYDLTEVC